MQAFVFSIPFTGMALTFLVTSIGAGIGLKFILLGKRQQKEHPEHWFHQPLIMLGISLLLMCLGQIGNLLTPVYTSHFNLSLSTQTLLNALFGITEVITSNFFFELLMFAMVFLTLGTIILIKYQRIKKAVKHLQETTSKG